MMEEAIQLLVHPKLKFEDKQEDLQMGVNREMMSMLKLVVLIELYVGFMRIPRETGMRNRVRIYFMW